LNPRSRNEIAAQHFLRRVENTGVEHIDGIRLNPPASFRRSEVVACYTGEAEAHDPRLLQSQKPIRPSLVVQRVRLERAETLEALAGRRLREVVGLAADTKIAEKRELVFADGSTGIIALVDLKPSPAIDLRQYHAFRVDDDVATTVVLTTPRSSLDPQTESQYLETLRSLSI
jgi:hypothetical protein